MPAVVLRGADKEAPVLVAEIPVVIREVIPAAEIPVAADKVVPVAAQVIATNRQ